MFSEVRKRAKKAGQPPGTAIYTGDKHYVVPLISVITYNADEAQEKTGNTLDACLPQKKFPGITWINVEGLSDVEIIKQLAQRFNLHPLTVEDILNVEQRAKVEEFDDYLFITLKVILWQDKTRTFIVKQLSVILGKDFVLSFQELDTTLFDGIRNRLLNAGNQPLRHHSTDYLVYRLIDAIVDEYFVVLEALGDKIEYLENRIIESPKPQNAHGIYKLKRQLLILRRAVWPMREAINHLLHLENNYISEFTRIYLRDAYDHTVQAVDSLETFREMLSSMLDMYLSTLTNRMNEIMKTLTIMMTIFIPITFIASLYGMNFPYMLGLHWRFGYESVLGLMTVVVIIMLVYFRKKEWL